MLHLHHHRIDELEDVDMLQIRVNPHLLVDGFALFLGRSVADDDVLARGDGLVLVVHCTEYSVCNTYVSKRSGEFERRTYVEKPPPPTA